MYLKALLALTLFAVQQGGETANNSRSAYTTPYLCNFAKVTHLKARSYLSVRSGPDSQFSKVDRLTAGSTVYICDERGDWLKISYSGSNGPCGAISPGGLDVRKTATCKSGWVKRERIDVISG
jgi:uncharacterized protein YgiM (DUF1202 family)